MQLYQSRTYEQFNYGTYARNLFYILDHDERFKLKEMIEELESKINEMIIEGRLKPLYLKNGKDLKKTGGDRSNLVGKDLEAIDFLKRICHFTEYPESVMLDPTAHQVETIVDKLLTKIYGKSFIDWIRVYVDRDKLDAHQMRDWMDTKRSIFFDLKDEGLLAKDFRLPY